MKRIKCILVMAFLAVCLMGCGKYENMFQINSDGTGSIAILYATNISELEAAGLEPDKYDMSPIFDELQDRGFTVQDYDKDGYEGYVVSAQNVDINETMNNLYVEGSGMEFAGFGPGRFNMTIDGNDCSIDWNLFSDEGSESIEQLKQTVEAYGASARITLYLPSPAYDHDAPYVSDEGASLQWDLFDLGSDQSIHAYFSFDGSAAAAGGQGGGLIESLDYLILVLGMFAVLGTGLFLYFSARKKEKMAEMYENYNGGMTPVSNPNPMAMGKTQGMQNNMWNPAGQQPQMNPVNQNMPSGAQWTPNQPQQQAFQPQQPYQPQQMSNLQPRQVSDYAQGNNVGPVPNSIPDWGPNN